MRNKKAQSGFILRVFSVMTYLIVLIIVLLLLNLPGCNPSNEVKKTVNSYSPEILQLRADEQLVAYLRTPIPGDIIARIDWARIEGAGINKDKWAGQLSSDDLNDAKNFLEAYPNVYKDKLYAEFLTNLYSYGNSDDKDQAKKAFDVVTKLTFLQKVEEHRAFLGRTLNITEIYFSPRISVEYPDPDGWKWKSNKADPISTSWDDTTIDGREPVAKAAIPLSGAKIVHVSFTLPARKIYMRLPMLEGN